MLIFNDKINMKMKYKGCNKMSTNEIRIEFMKKYKVEDLAISKYPKEIDRFFTHEFENIQDAIDGIIFYTNHEIQQGERLVNSYKIKSEDKIQKLINNTLQNCIHFFRFTKILDNSNIEYDCENVRNGNRIYEQINLDKIQREIQNRIDELIKSRKIQVTEAGLYYTREEEAYYKKEYAYQTNVQEYNSAWWTENLFSVVKYLRELEKSDENNYFDTWIHCKVEREKNSENNIEKRNENVKRLETAYAEYKQKIYERKIEDKEI